MNVIVPYVEFDPALKRALEDDGVAHRFFYTGGPTGYWDLLYTEWCIGRTFIVLEQDKFPAPGALRELWECEHPWCMYPVAMRGTAAPSPYPSLACTKFDESLMKADRTLMRDVGEIDVGLGEKEWSRLDMIVSARMERLADPHWHAYGRVEHRH